MANQKKNAILPSVPEEFVLNEPQRRGSEAKRDSVLRHEGTEKKK